MSGRKVEDPKPDTRKLCERCRARIEPEREICNFCGAKQKYFRKVLA